MSDIIIFSIHWGSIVSLFTKYRSGLDVYWFLVVNMKQYVLGSSLYGSNSKDIELLWDFLTDKQLLFEYRLLFLKRKIPPPILTALRQTYKYFPQQMEETEGEDIKLLKVQVVDRNQQATGRVYLVSHLTCNISMWTLTLSLTDWWVLYIPSVEIFSAKSMLTQIFMGWSGSQLHWYLSLLHSETVPPTWCRSAVTAVPHGAST